jgi:NADPH:quinone reductase-like Zn-dependent oxidoreductase/acyl carrier protein
VARAFQPAAPRTGKSLANGYKRPGGEMADPLQPSRRLELAYPGSFRGLKIGSAERQAPGRGQVEIRVHAAGLNYRDLMVAMNVYPGGEVAFGGECAGTITRVGEGVVNFAEGDEVIAVAHGAFADYVRTRSEFVVMKPPAFSFAESATLPVTFLTAHYAINHLARIRAGERILIHAGAGGVGLAALQLALQAGAEVLATAGNDAKRAFLQELGVKHTFSSRSLEFAEQVMQCTEGRGVDVVLNSLAGEFIPKSLSVMAPCGRFLEIGKRDICENTPLGMEVFKKNTAFFGIDLDLISQERPEMIQSMLLELLEWFNRGQLKPLPLQAFAIEEATAAFRHMAKAKHIGKVVLTLSDDAIDCAPAPGQPLDTGLREEILAADAEQRLQILESHIREQLSRALGISPAELDLHASLAEIGLDSLMALELKNRFEKQLEITLPVSTFLEGRSLAQLTRNISDLFDSGNGRPGSFLSAPPQDDAGDLLARLDSLSDANVDQLLDQLMKEGASVHGRS